ncbi:chymotrypsin-C-like isoform X2 [Diachasmimorpha longicaudata]|uniref:chymotrypsin-C-like isoform X2 n=1 Tax=Diachasmimorpha longicaudata TaxID=58733 RepID=UPI0030B90364
MKMCVIQFYTISVLSMSFIFYNAVEEVIGERLQRMVNADDAADAEFPSYAFINSLYIENGVPYLGQCGGSLVTRSHILTAAHCTTYHNNSALFVYYMHPAEVFVILGTTSIQEDSHRHNVKRIYRHEQHHSLFYRNLWSSYDVAILELQQPVDLGPTQQIINLPCYRPNVGEQGILVGSGSPHSPLARKLTKAVFKVVECDDWVAIGILCLRSDNTIVIAFNM